jgi:hypothetical protein
MAKTVCLDFDGVCSDYHGWRGAEVLDPPRPGLREFLILLQEAGYDIMVHSTRPIAPIVQWLGAYGLHRYILAVTDTKPPAVCYVDDRGICFRGDYGQTYEAIRHFRAYWEPASDTGRSSHGDG